MAMVMNGFSTSMGLARQAGRQMQRSTAKEERSSLVQNNEIEKNRAENPIKTLCPSLILR